MSKALNLLFLIEKIDLNDFQNVSGSGKEMGQAYINFIRNSMDIIRSKVNDELWILNFFEVSNPNRLGKLDFSQTLGTWI